MYSPTPFWGISRLTTDSPSYLANTPVWVTAQITNLGTLSGLFIAELQIQDAGGTQVHGFAPKNLGVLAGGMSVTITENWHTGLL